MSSAVRRHLYAVSAEVLREQLVIWHSTDAGTGTARSAVLALREVRRSLAERFAAEDPYFDRAWFDTACGGAL